ncbi:hypothetical protein Bbelb_139710, partial [Branchiostoma belcheri]
TKDGASYDGCGNARRHCTLSDSDRVLVYRCIRSAPLEKYLFVHRSAGKTTPSKASPLIHPSKQENKYLTVGAASGQDGRPGMKTTSSGSLHCQYFDSPEDFEKLVFVTSAVVTTAIKLPRGDGCRVTYYRSCTGA